jgi:hypothetical protein
MNSTTRLPGITGKPPGWGENCLMNWTGQFGAQSLFHYRIQKLSQAFDVAV